MPASINYDRLKKAEIEIKNFRDTGHISEEFFDWLRANNSIGWKNLMHMFIYNETAEGLKYGTREDSAAYKYIQSREDARAAGVPFTGMPEDKKTPPIKLKVKRRVVKR